MGEQLFEVCECNELLAEDWGPKEEVLIGGVEIFPTEDCLGNSNGVLLFPDVVGIPIRSENGCPNASQSFSTSA